MKPCKLTVVDEVNVCLTGVTDNVHDALKKYMRRFIPTAVHTPAFKMKRWDGFHNFYNKGWTFINLIDEGFLELIAKYGYEVDLIDRRETFVHDIKPVDINVFSHLEKNGEPIVLRDYQAHAANLTFQNNNGIFVMATGAGKSFSMATVASRYEDYGKVMVIVPSIDLTVQTAAAFRELGIAKVGEFYGEEKIVEQVTVTTWQSLKNYPEILDGVVCLMADECQEYKAKEVNTLLTVAAKNVPYRFGFTGTLPVTEVDQMLLTASLGPVLFTKDAWELQEEEILADCDITMLELQETDEDDLNEQLKDDHFLEHNFLTNNPKRIAWLAKYIQQVASTGNTLILTKNVDIGTKLAGMIPGAIAMSGKTKSKVRKQEYANIHTADNVPLFCTFGIAARGIDVPRLFHVILVDPGKDAIRIIQSIGRGLRRAKDKDHVDIHDVYSNLKYSKKHGRERRKLYDKARYPYKITKVYYHRSAYYEND